MYDLGWYKNIRFYLGKNILLWFLPVGKPLGDGFVWAKKDKF